MTSVERRTEGAIPVPATTNGVQGALEENSILYQINVPVLMTELQRKLGKSTANLNDVPDSFFDHIEELGVDLVYALGVWSVGQAGLEAARRVMAHSGLPVDDVHSSPFAITAYSVRDSLGGNEALKTFRGRLSRRGIRLIVDFVPNHVARDHPWVSSRPELIMKGNDHLLRCESQNYFHLREGGDVFAHGRDPHFDGWDDTAQLDYFEDQLREEMVGVLKDIATKADGVRCDMAMLVASDVLLKTWGHRYEQARGRYPSKPKEFWIDAIKSTKAVNPNFIFMAEVYWDMEATLTAQGFDFCYDKGLYDKLAHPSMNRHETHKCFEQPVATQHRLVRFLENHDEPRASHVFNNLAQHNAAALVCYCSPGLKFFHMGQAEGVTEFIPMQRRTPSGEEGKAEVASMYERLLDLVGSEVVRYGKFECAEIWPPTEGSDAQQPIIGFFYSLTPEQRAERKLRTRRSLPLTAVLLLVNYSGESASGWVKFPHHIISSKALHRSLGMKCLTAASSSGRDELKASLVIADLFKGSEVTYQRSNVVRGGVWFSLKPWDAHVFKLSKCVGE